MKLKVNEPLTPFNSCTGFGLKDLKDCHIKGLLLYHIDMVEERRIFFSRKQRGGRGGESKHGNRSL